MLIASANHSIRTLLSTSRSRDIPCVFLVITEGVARMVAHAMTVCVLFVSSIYDDFQHSTCVITGHSQSAKDIDAYCKSLFYVDPDYRNPALILPDGLSKPRQQWYDIKLFLSWMGFEPSTSWSTGQWFTTRSIPLRFQIDRVREVKAQLVFWTESDVALIFETTI